jgi:F-type H+-transporting ATPase subunit epsilon
MAKINFHLVTPERTVLNKELLSLSCPTELGQITILPDHVPLVANLVPGELVAKSEKGEEYIHVAGGFIQINPKSQVIVLADAAEHHYEIDIKGAEEAVARAKQALKETRVSSEEYAKVAASLERSMSKLHVARRHTHRRGAPLTSEGVFKE